jgi:predicted HTH transcriptional regulator
LVSQVKRLERKIEREQLVASQLPDLSAKLLELAREQGKITAGDAQTHIQAKRSTIKLHPRRLAASGHLVQHGEKRGSWYSSAN